MRIQEDAIRIAKYLMEHFVSAGELHHASIVVTYDEIVSALDLPSASYCRVCVQYLQERGIFEFEDNKYGCVEIYANAGTVDLLSTIDADNEAGSAGKSGFKAD